MWAAIVHRVVFTVDVCERHRVNACGHCFDATARRIEHFLPARGEQVIPQADQVVVGIFFLEQPSIEQHRTAESVALPDRTVGKIELGQRIRERVCGDIKIRFRDAGIAEGEAEIHLLV